MAAPAEVIAHVERFRRNINTYKRAEYNEAQVRVEFIAPFFEALGWDVRNVRGYAEQYKDVIHEAALKVGGATRAPVWLPGASRGTQASPSRSSHTQASIKAREMLS